jgi:SAM-dependent methyltransferase
VTFEEAIANFALRASLLRADFFSDLVLSLTLDPDANYQQRLGEQFREALLRAAAKQVDPKLRIGTQLFSYIAGDLHLYKTINFEGLYDFAIANAITDPEYRFVLCQVNEQFAYPNRLELTSHGLARSFRFWSLQEKVAYLDLANAVVSTLAVKFPDTCYGYGFVLSYVRDQDFIPHDDDIDILVCVEDAEYSNFSDAIRAVEDCLRASGYEVTGDWRTHRKVLHNGKEIDVFVGLHEGDDVAFFPGPRSGIRYSDVFPAGKSTFWGRRISTPQKPDVYLQKVYGGEWRRPKVGWRHINNWDLFAPRFALPAEEPSLKEGEAVAEVAVVNIDRIDEIEGNRSDTHGWGADYRELISMTDTNSWQDNALSLTMAAWSKGVKHEILFWRSWVAARGGQWSWDFTTRLDPEYPAQGLVDTLLNDLQGDLKVLDVGAGPLSVVGKTHKGRSIALSATDPLADFYSSILEKHEIVAPVPTQFATAEDLSLFFDDSSFDLVYCQNALDHSFDPIRAIVEMLRVLKVGGRIALNHHENEAENENYVGFHQFNFTKEENDFVIWNKTEKLNVRHLLPVSASLSVERVGENVHVVITKLSEFADVASDSRHRKRAGQLLRSLVNHYGSEEMSEPEI